MTAGPCLSRLRSLQSRKIDIGLGNVVKEVGHYVFGHEAYDLDDLCLAVACRLHRPDVVIAYLATPLGHLCRKANGRGCFCVSRVGLTIERGVFRRNFRQVGANVGVRREAIIAAVHLRNRDRDTRASLRIERS